MRRLDRHVLVALADGPLSGVELSRGLRVWLASAYGALMRLERAGLVVEEPGPGPRFRLTGAGVAAAEAVPPAPRLLRWRAAT